LYTGREYDRGTGLYYYRARYYDPEIGRFISEDPLGFKAGINFYAYVGNNSVNRNDPSGNCPSCVSAAINVIAGGAVRYFTPDQEVFDFGAIAIDAGIGAIGGGIAANFSRLTALGRGAQNVAIAEGEFLVSQVGNNLLSGNNIGNGIDGVSMTTALVSFPAANVGRIASNNASNALVSFSSAEQAAIQIEVQSTINTGIGVIRQNLNSPSFAEPGSPNFVGPMPSANASGGFVLYPNKPNTNIIQSVYSK